MFKNGGTGRRLVDGAGEERVGSSSRGLKPLYAKKLENWCAAVRDAPAASALLSSEALNVVTPEAHSVGAEESECESVTVKQAWI